MTYTDAKRILDLSKDGVDYPIALIVESLATTGDTERHTALPCQEINEFVDALRKSGAL